MTARRYVATEEILKEEMLEFERRFGLDSFELRRLYHEGEAPDHIEPFDQMVWTDTVDRWELARARNRAKATAAR